MSAAAFAPAAYAIDVTAGDWKLSIDGNVNAHYIYSRCDTNPATIAGGLACVDTDSSSSSVSNGLLPAALSISGATTQGAYDIGFTLGLYAGISTNDGGSPNLQNTPGGTAHTALGTAGLDIRQVFLTFGNKDMGTVMAGRNIGFFGGDAILNDMTLLGVGAGNGSYAAPANTSLGSIGLGYIYTDWLSQIDYTTPDIMGIKGSIGIFDPLNTLSQIPASKKAPGIQAKVAYTAGPLYLSASGLFQQQRNTTGTATVPSGDYNSWAVDFGGKYDIAGFEVAGWYYVGKGVGTTGLFVNSNDPLGNARDSNGFLAQVTYKIQSKAFGRIISSRSISGKKKDAAGTLSGTACPRARSRTSTIRCDASTLPPATAAGMRAFTIVPSGASTVTAFIRPAVAGASSANRQRRT